MTSRQDPAREVDRLRALEASAVDSVRDVVQRAIVTSTLRLVSAEPVLRADVDPEGVHAARVTVRRLRSDLRTFRHLLDEERTRPLRAELEWLGDVLGSVREVDVLRDRVRRRLREAPSELTPAKVLVEDLESQRIDAFRRLVDAIDSPRYADVIEALMAAAWEPPVGAPGDLPAVDAARSMDRPWSALRRSAGRLGPDSSDRALHEVRIRAKRVRYGAEALGPVFGKPARRFASSAKKLQGRLGDHQDAVVAVSWLTEAALDSDDPGVAFAAGRLAEQESADRDRARERWPRAWKALRDEKTFWT
ncbi:MAG TPA: CHAD domain-containing protein [Actinomycetota bacterium]|nr:CHAD domain-containing protein [Actinomycetota bacterium]